MRLDADEACAGLLVALLVFRYLLIDFMRQNLLDFQLIQRCHIITKINVTDL